MVRILNFKWNDFFLLLFACARITLVRKWHILYVRDPCDFTLQKNKSEDVYGAFSEYEDRISEHNEFSDEERSDESDASVQNRDREDDG